MSLCPRLHILFHARTITSQGVGFVTEQMIKEHIWSPDADVLVVVCGPAPMCAAVKRHLDHLGYSQDSVYSFM